MDRMRCWTLAVGAMALATIVRAADVTVPAPGGVGDVVALTNALTQAKAGTYVNVLLEPGLYDLAGVKMTSDSHLDFQNCQGHMIIGLGAKPGETVLKGGGATDQVRVLSVSGDNWNTVTVSNLTVTGGFSLGNGGGVGAHAAVRVIDCIISNNFAYGTSGYGGGGLYLGLAIRCHFADNTVGRDNPNSVFGGGLYVTEQVTPRGLGMGAIGCTFSNNWARSGGGGFYGDSFATNCTFTGNVVAEGFGGGAFSARWLTECVFVANRSEHHPDGDNSGYGGGAYGIGAVTNCTFRDNASSYESGGGLVTLGDVPVVGCTFENNTCLRKGGGLLCYGGLVSNCTFRCNRSAGGSASEGGGLAMLKETPSRWPTDYTEQNKTFRCVDCRFYGNVADVNGGGAMAPGGFFGCTFVTNTASVGGGLHADRASTCGPVSNCTFFLNKGLTDPGACALSASADANGLTAVGCELSGNTNGTAAALCVKNGTTPRALETDVLTKKLIEQGVFLG